MSCLITNTFPETWTFVIFVYFSYGGKKKTHFFVDTKPQASSSNLLSVDVSGEKHAGRVVGSDCGCFSQSFCSSWQLLPHEKRIIFHFALLAVSCRMTRGVCIAASASPINGANHQRSLLPRLSPRCFKFPLPSRRRLPQTRAARSFGGTTSRVCRVVQRETASKPGRHRRIVVPSDASALLHCANARRSSPATHKQKSLFGQARVSQIAGTWGGLQWLLRVVEVVHETSAVLKQWLIQTFICSLYKVQRSFFVFFFCVWGRDTLNGA